MREGATIREEVQSLAGLARQKDSSNRHALYHRTVSLLEHEHEHLADVERSLICDILRRLARDVEMSVRQKLAERLATDDAAPAELLILLANDQIEVARPVLLYSKLLSDTALIEIIRHRSIQHRMSIAARRNLSNAVSSALIQAGDEAVVVALLHNPSASIPPAAFAQLVARADLSEPLRAPLVGRSDLPVELAARLYTTVSQELRDALLASFPIDRALIDAAVADSVAEIRAEQERDTVTRSSSQRLVDKLFEAGQLTPAFVVKSLNQGQIELFELAFAKLVNISPEIFRKILYGRGAEGVAISCRAIGIDRSVFLTIYRLTRVALRQSPDLSDAETGRAFTLFQNMDKRRAAITLHRWAADESRARLI